MIKSNAQNPEGGEPVYFSKFKASLRILGDGLDFDEITRTLGLTPTGTRRKGSGHGLLTKDYDIWIYTAPVDRVRPLDEHIMAIWDAIRPQIPYLRELKRRFRIDVLCGYRSNSCTGGFDVDQRCLGLFTELDIPFGVSVMLS